MYAIIETGGKQLWVIPGETVKVEKLEVKEGETLTCNALWAVGDAPEGQEPKSTRSAKVTGIEELGLEASCDSGYAVMRAVKLPGRLPAHFVASAEIQARRLAEASAAGRERRLAGAASRTWWGSRQ